MKLDRLAPSSSQQLLNEWEQRSLKDLWYLFQNFSSNDHDFLVIVEIVGRKILKNKFLNLSEAERHFFKVWKKRFSLDKRDSLQAICKILSFDLSWSLKRISFMTDLPVSRISFLLSHAIRIDKYSHDEELHPLSADCSLLELYLPELILNQSLPLSKKKEQKIKNHLFKCSRCQNLLEKGQQTASQSQLKVMPGLPNTVEDWFVLVKQETKPLQHDLISKGFPKFSERLFIPLAVVCSILSIFLVSRIPYLGELKLKLPEFRKEWFVLSDNDAVVDPIHNWIDINDYGRTLTPAWEAHSHDVPPEPIVRSLQNYLKYYKDHSQSSKKVEVAKIKQVEPVVDLTPVLQSEPNNAVPTTSLVFYQWGAFSAQSDADADYLLTLLKEYSAIQAGELALGAEYKGGRYFHFEIPEARFAMLQEKVSKINLQDFTSKQARSSRKSKAGHIRVVFLILPKK